MTRALLLCLKIAIVVAVAIWLANQPGTVTIDWLGWRVEKAPVGLLVLAALILAAVAALLYRFWRAIYRAPRSFGEAVQSGRRQRGYKALSHGMVAVAAGDQGEANRWAKKAENLLQDPPLTMLLSAQAAQMNGQDGAAKKLFLDMLENPETRFLGLRGLLSQALEEGDDDAALDYVKKAHAIRPKTPWVLTNLFELSERNGDLVTAENALKEAAKANVLTSAEATAKRSAVILQRALITEAEGRRDEAMALARMALKLAGPNPGCYLAAAITLARLAGKAGRERELRKTAEQAWARQPHPELAEAYQSLKPGKSPMDAYKHLQRLAAANDKHPDSHLILAGAALKAELWGEARRHLEAAAKKGATAPVCTLMAELEESEHGNAAAAREWLGRALSAPPGPTWVCNSCGSASRTWASKCGVCGTFNILEWRQPPQVDGMEALEAPIEAAEKNQPAEDLPATNPLLSDETPTKASAST
ncbi:MAG: heme biosynthesis HemY N-terminal domain-containing protein [Pseudomonadota bacterium]